MFTSARSVITVALLPLLPRLEFLPESSHLFPTPSENLLDLRRVLVLGIPLPDLSILFVQLGPMFPVVALYHLDFLVAERGDPAYDLVRRAPLLKIWHQILHRDPARRELQPATPIDDFNDPAHGFTLGERKTATFRDCTKARRMGSTNREGVRNTKGYLVAFNPRRL
jgi:hypothetical protein